MIFFRIKNWMKHQHYKDRRPPWIKLHNTVFDDYEFQQLTDTQRWHLVAIWLLASRSNRFHEDGDPLLPEDEKYLTRHTGSSTKIDLKPLYSAGFLIRYQDDSNLIAKCYSETEAYRSKEETDKSIIVSRPGNGRFHPPTLDEVSEHVKSRGGRIDPVKFHAHYTSNGWKVGKNPMRSWKAAIVTWERSANQ